MRSGQLPDAEKVTAPCAGTITGRHAVFPRLHVFVIAHVIFRIIRGAHSWSTGHAHPAVLHLPAAVRARCRRSAAADAGAACARRCRSGGLLGERKTGWRTRALGRRGTAAAQWRAHRGAGVVHPAAACTAARRRTVDGPRALRRAVGPRTAAAAGRGGLAAGALHAVRTAGRRRRFQCAARAPESDRAGRRCRLDTGRAAASCG